MKNLWKIVSFMSVVNLLAFVLFVGWLWRTDRLSVDRLERLRDMLAITNAEEATRTGAAAAQAALDAAAAEETAVRSDPPLPSAAQVARTVRLDDRTRQAVRRLDDESSQHQAALELRSRQLDAQEEELRARQDEWAASIRADAERRIDEQFLKTVRLYEALAGKQAKRMLLELVDQDNTEQAVAYIDAMSPRAAARTLKELKTDPENALATELLERLRTFGGGAELAETPGHANAASDSG